MAVLAATGRRGRRVSNCITVKEACLRHSLASHRVYVYWEAE